MSRRRESTLVSIGCGTMVISSKAVAVLSPEPAPMRCMKDDAKERNMQIDATQGRKIRSIVITDSDHIILSAVQFGPFTQRFHGGEGA